MRLINLLVLPALLLLLTACGEPSKAEIIEKAQGANTKSKLESALGRPDDFDKLGPIEKWTYEAKDGQVTFIITGDAVAIEFAGSSESSQ